MLGRLASVVVCCVAVVVELAFVDAVAGWIVCPFPGTLHTKITYDIELPDN